MQTWLDTPQTWLTPKGIQQAHQKGVVLSGSPVDVIIHSNKHRARQTAAIIAAYLGQPSLIEDENVADGNLAYFDGLSIAEIQQRYPNEYAQREADKFHYRLPNREGYPQAESLADVVSRIAPALDGMIDRGQHTLVVSHRNSTRACLYHLARNTDYALAPEAVASLEVGNSVIYRVQISEKERTFSHHTGAEWKEGIQ